MCDQNKTSEFCKLHGGCMEDNHFCKHYVMTSTYRNEGECLKCSGYDCKFEKGIYISNYQI